MVIFDPLFKGSIWEYTWIDPRFRQKVSEKVPQK